MPDPSDPMRARTLILCFDGTGDSFDEDNSNVVQFCSMLKKDDATKQLVYYQAGIGTYTNPVLVTPFVSGISKVVDQMVAWNLAVHVMEGYQFLMQNYTAGDRICIFGFSRGAFTARAVAGMLQKVGLLPKSNLQQLTYAYTMYARDDDVGLKLSVAFKRAFSVDVKIDFLGCWDTVQSVGLIPRHLPFSGSNNAVVTFRHALSLDEHRVKFIPSFSTSGKTKEEKKAHMHEIAKKKKGRHSPHREESIGEYEKAINMMTGGHTDVLEVFFAGAHCDVGGGSVINGTRHSLARIPLRWMIREIFKADVGIIFDAHMLKHEVGFDVESPFQAPPRLKPDEIRILLPEKRSRTLKFLEAIWSVVTIPFSIIGWLFGKLRIQQKHEAVDFLSEESRFISEGEAKEELHDALSPIYDEMESHLWWRIMEWIPFLDKKQFAEVDGIDDPWAYKWVWNRGAGRVIYRPVIKRGMKVHRSVKTRIEALDHFGNSGHYIPQVRPHLPHEKPRQLTFEEWNAENPEHFEWVD